MQSSSRKNYNGPEYGNHKEEPVDAGLNIAYYCGGRINGIHSS
jgi:hypothetical protein